jgi:hypothetical protein
MTTKIIEDKTSDTPTLNTVQQFCQANPWETPGGLRFKIFNAKNNGLQESGAIVRIGRKVLINVPRYFGWIESQQNKKGGV